MSRMLLMLVLSGLVPQLPESTNNFSIVDARDQQRYPVIEVAGMQWLGRNLVFDAPGSSCPDGGNDCAHGRLYPWTVANTSCPAGWHLATEDEWQRLERHLGMSASELSIEKERGKGTGDALKRGGAAKMDIPLHGWRRPDGSYREGNGNDRAAALWTAGRVGDDEAWHRDLSSARTGIWRSAVPFAYSLSVRCVKD